MTQTPPRPVLGRLDTNTLEEIARVICGDDHLFYRKGWEIARFLSNAGWTGVPDYDGTWRKQWVLDQLLERRDDPADIEQVLLRLANPLEYLEEPGQLPNIVTAVNNFLIHEGFRLETPGGRPRLVACDPALTGPGQHAPAEFRTTIAELIDDDTMAKLLQHRLDEAQACYQNGAHIAAIIMLGTLLEGLLLQVVQERNPALLGGTSRDRVYLDKLIKTSHDAGWIGADIERFCHELRQYRNYVHPNAEIRGAHTPDRDTLNVAWQVVSAVLNDLAATRPASNL